MRSNFFKEKISLSRISMFEFLLSKENESCSSIETFFFLEKETVLFIHARYSRSIPSTRTVSNPLLGVLWRKADAN